MAWPTWRCRRLDSLLISRRRPRLAGVGGRRRRHGAHGSSFIAKDFAADRLAVGTYIGLLALDARGAHLGWRHHHRQHVVASVSCRCTWPRATRDDAAADEVVVEHLVELVARRRRHGQRHEELDVDQHPLLAALLEVIARRCSCTSWSRRNRRRQSNAGAGLVREQASAAGNSRRKATSRLRAEVLAAVDQQRGAGDGGRRAGKSAPRRRRPPAWTSAAAACGGAAARTRALIVARGSVTPGATPHHAQARRSACASITVRRLQRRLESV